MNQAVNIRAPEAAPLSRRKPAWQSGPFSEQENDPLSGFANIMDVMLVFALGLMMALIAQSQELRQHFQLESKMQVTTGQELTSPPEAIQKALKGEADGMESLGQVYRDPKTGKLILVGGQ